MLRTFIAALLLLLVASPGMAQSLDADLRALDAMRKGFDTALDEVESRGVELLERYEAPQDQAQIRFMLAHVHAQSGMKQPETILKHSRAALDSKLITPQQRGTLFSYIASAHEVDKEVKDFAERRRKALAVLLEGLKELQAFNLPEKAPELPAFGSLRDGPFDPAEAARARAEAERAQAARERAQRIGELVFRRDVLKLQVKGLYYREPVADDELRKLATEAVGEDLAEELVATAKAERERIEKARKEREAKK